MKLRVIVHPSDEGGYRAEVPSMPGRVTQGETMDELQENLREAIAGKIELDLVAAPAASDQSDPLREPDFFRYFGSIKAGPGSSVDDVRQVRSRGDIRKEWNCD